MLLRYFSNDSRQGYGNTKLGVGRDEGLDIVKNFYTNAPNSQQSEYSNILNSYTRY